MKNFKRVYDEHPHFLGYEAEDDTWLLVHQHEDGVFIDKAYRSSEPCLTVKQARKFAKKILAIADRIEKTPGKK